MTSETSANGPLDAEPGQAVYSNRILMIYDLTVLRIAQPLAWRCPSSRILKLYNEYVSAEHLDVGVGTGYLLNKCRFPEPKPRVTILDMNANSLAFAADRLKRYEVHTHRANVLEPIDLPSQSFGSVGLNCLLHCLPGTMEDKIPALANLRTLMRPGAALFGTTVMVRNTRHNLLGRILVSSWNNRGIWSNRQDDPESLESALSAVFPRYQIDLVGRSAVFVAWA